MDNNKILINGDLKILEQQAITLLSTGSNITNAALELGVDRRQIYRWLDNPNFKTELERIIDNNVSYLMLDALEQLEKVMQTSNNDKDKLKAIELIFRANDRFNNTIVVEQTEKKTLDLDKMLIDLETL